jgi:hypothetical protein
MVILAVLVVAVAGVYTLVVVLSRQRAAAPGPAPQSAPAVVELSEAHSRAQAYAAGWQGDARLVGVTGGWHGIGADLSALSQSSWAFRYYSADARALQVVSVESGGISVLPEVPVRQALSPVEADWSFRGRDILITYLAHGGEAFLADHPQATVRAQLSARQGGRSIWYLSAVDAAAGASHQVRVDALSRRVIVE